MPRDISELLTVVMSTSWSIERSVATLDALAKALGPLAAVDWDRGAGEHWARLVSDSRVVGYVSMRKPFVVLEVELSRLVRMLEEGGLRVLLVSSLTDRSLRAARASMEAWAGRAISDTFDPEAFSADDFWWATV